MKAVSCSCGKVEDYEIIAADLTSGQKAPAVSDKNARLSKNIFDDVWDVTGMKASTYEVYLNAQASSGNAKNGYWNFAAAIANGGKATDNGATVEPQADYKKDQSW